MNVFVSSLLISVAKNASSIATKRSKAKVSGRNICARRRRQRIAEDDGGFVAGFSAEQVSGPERLLERRVGEVREA